MSPFRPLLALTLLGISAFGLAQGAKPDATQLLDLAKARAAKENKAVFVLFEASWCKWCDRFKKAMEKPELKAVLDENFVTVNLIVYERDKKNPETAGAYEILDWLGGRKSGIPFYAVLRSDGKVMATSMLPAVDSTTPVNAGYPGAATEITHFVEVLRKGASRIKPEQLEAIRALFALPIEP